MCPHCGKNAPVVNRGLATYCTACGRPRLPFTGKSVNLAGTPSRLGGTVAGVLGWLVLIGGVTLALLLGLLLAALFPGQIVGPAVGLPIGFASLALGILLLLGGRKLRRSGTETGRDVQIQAIFSLAAHRGRALTAQEVGLALDLPTQKADELLTQLAKERSDEVTVDIGERGEILYGFPGLVEQRRVRVAGPGVRVDAGPFAPTPGDALSAEFEALEDAEDAPRAPPRREPVR
jgi:hypothetical protein